MPPSTKLEQLGQELPGGWCRRRVPSPQEGPACSHKQAHGVCAPLAVAQGHWDTVWLLVVAETG